MRVWVCVYIYIYYFQKTGLTNIIKIPSNKTQILKALLPFNGWSKRLYKCKESFKVVPCVSQIIKKEKEEKIKIRAGFLKRHIFANFWELKACKWFLRSKSALLLGYFQQYKLISPQNKLLFPLTQLPLNFKLTMELYPLNKITFRFSCKLMFFWCKEKLT